MANIHLSVKDYLIIAGWTVICTAVIVAITFLADYDIIKQLDGDVLRQNIRNDIVVPTFLGIVNFGVLFWKIRQLANAKKILEKMASTDSLTGVLNRRAFQSYVEAALASKSKNTCALMVVDLDLFKKVNDTYGHEMGDRALIAVASAIEDSLQSGEIFGRIGGEEFVLFLPRTTAALAALTAEKVRMSVETNPFGLDHLNAPLTVSIGVAVSTGTPDFINMYKIADVSLYQAKKLGRNRVVSAAPEESSSTIECDPKPTGNAAAA